MNPQAMVRILSYCLDRNKKTKINPAKGLKMKEIKNNHCLPILVFPE